MQDLSREESTDRRGQAHCLVDTSAEELLFGELRTTTNLLHLSKRRTHFRRQFSQHARVMHEIKHRSRQSRRRRIRARDDEQITLAP